MRTRPKALALAVLTVALLWSAAPSVAQDPDGHDGEGGTTTPVSIPEGVGLDEGIFVTGAVVTPLDGGDTTRQDDYHAAVFMQSFLGTAYFGGPEVRRDLPPDLPIYRVDFSGTWVHTPGNVTAYYATDGVTPYISFTGFTVWTDPADAPPPTTWFAPPERAIHAFNGEEDLVPTTGTYVATSIPQGSSEEASPPGSSPGAGSPGADAPWPWIAAGAAVLVVLAGVYRQRRRRRQLADAPT